MAKIAAKQQQGRSAANPNRPLTESEQQEVERLAYRFFVERGYQHGNDQEDWLRAEQIVRKRRASRFQD